MVEAIDKFTIQVPCLSLSICSPSDILCIVSLFDVIPGLAGAKERLPHRSGSNFLIGSSLALALGVVFCQTSQNRSS
jgi:hypothetical protein